ncbi:hypothetical protein, conserved [Trypanosoma brucei gambiense DAL972]|uniref:Kinetoplastid kinetochore protein 11 n=1 Tax=Trypanosoma brucei gambiense (strain MHOM/CI/86/DAL972) TaxID=679716 RepID=C9ZSC9_TRYB9|nr:hypothetical protein, conserved [Trypanosoma brucei gambiense DAL972]CBH12267.1 hypothetical protein, conserved [Trypanosoma brucei gambiense DAL972]|eukprot:XP_011774548.1 hypothetical protein, conserved [Trypanosoma brucei gambiense DAL972]
MTRPRLTSAPRGSALKEAISAHQALRNAVAQEQSALDDELKKNEQILAEHEQLMRDWSCDKEGVLATIQKMKEKIAENESKTTEARAEVKQNEEIVKRLHARNEEYEPRLEASAIEIAERLKKREEEEKEMREQLLTFQIACQEREQQYRDQIHKLEETNAQEAVDHQQKVQQLRSKIAEVEATMEEERRAWVVETEMRKQQRLIERHKFITEEAEEARKGKEACAAIMKEASALRMDSNLLSSLDDLLCC